jgi:CRP-like cAMP-binding protein
MKKRAIQSRDGSRTFDTVAFLSKSGHGRVISKWASKEIIFGQGAVADSVFYIRNGKVKLIVVSTEGKEAVVAILDADNFFGEGCLIGQTKRLATAKALTRCEIACIKKDTIMSLVHDQADFALMFLSHILARSARIEEDLVDQLFNSTEKRLARVLLLLANFGKDGRPEPIPAKISQETLAEMIGATRSRVNIFMNKFRKAGFIDYKDRIEVHSSLLSLVLADQPHSINTW